MLVRSLVLCFFLFLCIMLSLPLYMQGAELGQKKRLAVCAAGKREWHLVEWGYAR